MLFKIMLLALAILLSLLLLAQRAIAEPIEIEVEKVVVVPSSNIRVYAFEKVLERWGEKQWSYFSELIERESHWNSNAQNPNSTAYGLGQFLNSTWKSVGCKKTSDQFKQIDCAIKYVDARYGSPQKAIKFHDKNNWY